MREGFGDGVPGPDGGSVSGPAAGEVEAVRLRLVAALFTTAERRDMAWSMRSAERVAMRDGIAPPGRLRRLRALWEAAATFAGERGEYAAAATREESVASSSGCWSDPVGSAEAARMLGTSRRNVQALCRRGSFETAGRRDGRWLVERVEAAARARQRSRVAAAASPART